MPFVEVTTPATKFAVMVYTYKSAADFTVCVKSSEPRRQILIRYGRTIT